MKYFLDTEFVEYPYTIDLISIGIVSETGSEFSAISSEYDSSKADDWVVENVLKPLWNVQMSSLKQEYTPLNFHRKVGLSREEIRDGILAFVDAPIYSKGAPEFWGYYSDYDWVVFCWLFGRMIDLPKGFPMYCRDLKQEMDSGGIQALPAPTSEHDALADARWNLQMYNHIKSYRKEASARLIPINPTKG
jgi:hypothetical protein